MCNEQATTKFLVLMRTNTDLLQTNGIIDGQVRLSGKAASDAELANILTAVLAEQVKGE